MTLKSIEQEITRAENEIRRLREDQNRTRGNKMFRCVSCKGTHKISACVAIEPLHYSNEPYNEDWYSDGELWAVCPKTGVANRFLFEQDWNLLYKNHDNVRISGKAAFFQMYYDLFKDVKQEERGKLVGVIAGHKDTSWINSDYIDKNRKKFGLPQPSKKCDCRDH